MAEIVTPQGTVIGLIVEPEKEKEETEAAAKKAGRPKKAAEK